MTHTKNKHTVSVFCGRYYGNDQKHYQGLAQKTGELLAKAGHKVATGGGPGQMCDVNKAAYEAGGEVISLQFKRYDGFAQCEYFTEKESYDDISVRQKRLIDIADAMFVLPGGIGTIYEVFQVLVLKKISAVDPRIPVIFIDKSFYKSIREFVVHGCEVGFIEGKIEELCEFVDTPEEAVERLQTFFQK